MAAQNSIIAGEDATMEPDTNMKVEESPGAKKGCRKQELGTGCCDCTLLCQSERYQTLTEQKDKNQIKQDEVIVYISGGGLAFCANAASDMLGYVFPGFLFVLTIVAVIYSFWECLYGIDLEMAKIRKEKAPQRWFGRWMEYIRKNGKSQMIPNGNDAARLLFVLSLVAMLITATYS